VYSFFSLDFMLLMGAAATAFVLGRNFHEIIHLITTDEQSLEKSILNSAPAILWIEQNEEIVWSNKAFDKLVMRLGKSIRVSDFDFYRELTVGSRGIRADLQTPNPDRMLYFNLTKHELKYGTLYIAVSAKDAVIAEKDRTRFVQTLSETFGHLPIGMAVFDKDRDLSMFNPALSELLDLNTLWLTQRPSLRDFLDRLHDKGAIPEPRNFKSWRDQILDMETSAQSGTFSDDWHLPNDRILRVSGRPHPAGAVAFVFEDITRVTATEREYRIELERLYAVMDLLNSAVLVFDASGNVSLANDAFDQLWGTDLSNTLSTVSATEVSKILGQECLPTRVLGEIRDFVLTHEERGSWKSDLVLKNGSVLDVHAVPLSTGYSLIEFQLSQTEIASTKGIENIC